MRFAFSTVLLAAFLFLPGAIIASHAPYDWEYVCNMDNFVDNYTFKNNYKYPDFLEKIAANIAMPGCSDQKINVIKADFKEGLKFYEQWKYSSPIIRASAKLANQTTEKNFLFADNNTGYFSVVKCTGKISVEKSVFPVQVGSKGKTLPKATRFMSAVHELGHLQQNNTHAFVKEGFCISAHNWHNEAIVDHLAIQATNDKFNTDLHGPFLRKKFRRFFLNRPYYVPLNLQPNDNKEYSRYALNLLGYKTNGFWDFVSRNYLNDDYSQYESFYRSLTKEALSNQTKAVHDFLDKNDGVISNGLKHIFPQFLTEYATWHKHRFKGFLKKRDALWMATSFEGCEKISITPGNPVSQVVVKIDRYAGRCLDVTIDELVVGGEDLSVHIAAIDPSGAKDIVDQLYLGVSEVKNTDKDFDCYQFLKNNDATLGPCLLDPVQGKNTTLMGRFWSTDSFKSNGAAPKARFIISRVPQDLKDIANVRDLKDIELTISLSKATMSVNGKKKNSGVTANSMAVSSQNLHANLAVKTNNTTGNRSVNINMADILKGRMPMMMPEIPVNTNGIRMLFFNETPEQDSDYSGQQEITGMIVFKEEIPYGKTGTFIGVGTINLPDNKVAVDFSGKNNNERSYLTVTRFDSEMIQYNGVINACILDMNNLTNISKICQNKITMSIEGNIAFGGLMIGNNRLTEVITPDYESYRNLRIARIDNKFGSNFVTPEKSDSSSAASGGGVNNSGSAASSSSSQQAEVINGCDCSCETLMAKKKDRSKMDMNCMMTCMSQMMQCSFNKNNRKK